MNKIVIAPDSFKESMTATQITETISNAFKEVDNQKFYFDLIPLADGGEGTILSLMKSYDATERLVKVTGPLGDEITAKYGISKDKNTALIEMAEASGLERVSKERRNPLKSTTYGTGEIIETVLNLGVKKIIIGVGGSATNDGGAGMIMALGGKFFDIKNEEIPLGAEFLTNLSYVDLSNLHPRLRDVDIKVACDVENPLLGENGATSIYGPQKGATHHSIPLLEEGLENFHTVMKQATFKDVKDIPGSGAAGGLGAGLLFLNAQLRKGIDVILEENDFAKRIEGASLIITGEGKIDGQTIFGKTPIGVAKIAKEKDINVIAVCGVKGVGYEKVYDYGINAVFSISNGPSTLEEALENSINNLRDLSVNLAKILKLPLP